MEHENQTPAAPAEKPQPAKRGWRGDFKILGLALLVALAFVTGLLVRGGGGDNHDHGGGAAAGAQEQVHTCPMHPEIRNQGPGKCPICGMDLIPMAQEEEGDLGPRQLALSPRALALLNVQTSPVERLAADSELRLSGRVEADETRLRSIAARVPARIEKLYVDFTGTTVERGARLVQMYSPDLLVTQEELLQAAAFARRVGGDAALAETAKRNLQAARDKLRLWGLTSGQISAIEKSGRTSEVLTITAPVGGVVIEKDAREGEYVDAGQRIYAIADLSQVWVQLEAYESDLPRIRNGAKVTLSTQAAPGKPIEGTVSFISPTVDPQSRTVRVRVSVQNKERLLKPGMFVEGTLRARPAGPGESPLVIPATAPLLTGRRAVVYVQVPDRDRPTYEGRDVVLGARVGDRFVVESGLEAGELVVTHGGFRLDAELQLRGRPSMMSPDGGGDAPGAHEGHGAPVAKAGEPATPRVEVPAEFSKQVGRVVQAQFALVEALAGDDPSLAKAAAADTRQALDQVDAKLAQGVAKDLWSGAQRKMADALARVSAQDELEPQRRAFEQFSDELTRAVRWFGTGDVGPVFRAMCPMVQNRDAYWLQAQREVTNPYWGAAMYNCGEVAETLVEGGHGR